MNRPKRLEDSRSPRGGGPGRPPRPQQNDKPAAQFAKPARMASAKSQLDGKRLVTSVAAVEEYLGPPPAGQDLVSARLVIPGKHMLPPGLDNPTALDGIRRQHKVWIANIEPNILNVCSDSMPRLQEAIQAINQAIHDMRLSNKRLATQYFLQQPSKFPEDVPIRVELGSRPCLTDKTTGPCDMSMALGAHLLQLSSDLRPSAEILMPLDADLRMRVNFGRLNIRQKKKGLGNELTRSEFESLMKAYSVRGGARMDTWLGDTRLTEKIFQRLTDPSLGICPQKNIVGTSYSLTLQVEDRELLVDAIVLPDSLTQLSAVSMSKSESSARVNWTMVAPDMKFDWNLRVDSRDVSFDIPANLRELAEGMSLKFSKSEGFGGKKFIIPHVTVCKPGNWEGKISETRLKTSVAIPVRETPYEIEISITQIWKGLKTTMEPETGWGIEIYGIHWDEAMNQVSPGEQRKDWGEGLENIWVGMDPSLENRFGDFLQIVLEIQSALEGVASIAT